MKIAAFVLDGVLMHWNCFWRRWSVFRHRRAAVQSWNCQI